MSKEMQTFKVICSYCNKPFHVRFAPADPHKQEAAEVVVRCQYCDEHVMITLPRKYVRETHLIRGLESHSSDARGEIGA